MRSKRSGYLMAMLAGLAIVGASTGAVLTATHAHEQSLLTAAGAVTAAANSSDALISGTTQSDAATSQEAPTAGPLTSAAGAQPPASTAVGSTPRTRLSTVLAAPSTKSATTAPSTTAPPTSRPATTARATTAPAPTAPTTNRPATTALTTSRPATAAPVVTAAAAVQKFKDGQYQATGSYNSPGGTEKLGVTLTLVHDKVTRSSLELLGGVGLSRTFQSAFASGYAPQVVGKRLDTISLGAVSGSSLTSLGFNEALKQIADQARA